MKGEAGHALDIARNVLSLAQGEGATEVVDCNALVERALLLRELALTRAGIQTVTELSDSPLIVRGRPVRLLQAVLNILVNAEQALADSVQPRRLMLRTRRSTAGSSARALASIEIANNGPRIATPLLPHLFQPFFTTKPRGQGTGLGLTMAREAVSRTGGRIVVENIAPGELFAEGGVRFRIDVPLSKRLPRRPSDAGLQRTGPQTMDADARPSRPLRRALVIEDDRSLGALLKAMLRDMGWQARLRGNAEDAIAEIDRVPYDAIISDLKLPGPSGEWLMEQIRARRPELVDRVLFITGDTISPAARAFLRSAGRPVLPKPFHLRELAEAMESLVEPRRKRESDAIQFRNA